jgi:hypothetical protein
MGFFTDLFKKDKKKSESAVLIDIGPDSVAGAYVHHTKDAAPILLHTNRIPIEFRDDESYERAMLRALGELGNNLIREGAPILARATGSGRSDNIVVSIDTPLQETSMRTEDFERGEAFIFTKNIADTMLQRTRAIPDGKSLIDESIVSAVLNGYETRNPYEKNARKVSLTIFSSFIDEEILESVISTLRELYLTENILKIAGKALRYQAIRSLFPHEPKPDSSSLEQAIDAAHSWKLWIPGNPPKIVEVLPSHISGLVRQATLTPPDMPLLLMALYNQEHSFNEKI